MRMTQDQYFLKMALLAGERSNCYRRNVGCILVDKKHRILSTGYNGVPRGVDHCKSGECPRDRNDPGSNLSSCYAIHAEMNALISCPDVDRIHKAYVTYSPCLTCTVMLMNTSCEKIIFLNEYPGADDCKKLWVRGFEYGWTHATDAIIPG